jgi:hypothetical protein
MENCKVSTYEVFRRWMMGLIKFFIFIPVANDGEVAELVIVTIWSNYYILFLHIKASSCE